MEKLIVAMLNEGIDKDTIYSIVEEFKNYNINTERDFKDAALHFYNRFANCRTPEEFVQTMKDWSTVKTEAQKNKNLNQERITQIAQDTDLSQKINKGYLKNTIFYDTFFGPNDDKSINQKNHELTSFLTNSYRSSHQDQDDQCESYNNFDSALSLIEALLEELESNDNTQNENEKAIAAYKEYAKKDSKMAEKCKQIIKSIEKKCK